MSSQSGPERDFVETWIENARSNSNLDPDILSLVDKHRKGSALDEAALLQSLIGLASTEEAKDATS